MRARALQREAMVEGPLQVGSRVQISAWLCRMDLLSGEVIHISDWDEDTMPYTVQTDDFREWPYSRDELVPLEEI
jgi:hypothetical protein